MSDENANIVDPDFQKAEAALIRAGKRARELGRQLNVPVYVIQDGKIVDINQVDPHFDERNSNNQ
ncbi:MAG: hypothetical protein AB1656_04280 [Candidatus Omnitrophota bacterium]